MLRTRLAGRTPWLIVGVVVLILFLVPFFAKSPFYVDLMIWIFLFTLFTAAVYQIAVVNRLLFGAAAFVGIGAYTSALLTLDVGMPFWPAMVLAGVAAAFVAFVIGIPILRVGGVYFAIITWCLGEVLVSIYRGVPVFRGTPGVWFIPAPTILGTEFVGKAPYYYLALGLMLVTLAFFYWLGKSRFGQDLRAIGLSDTLAASLGINVPRYRLICFAIACFFLGIGGSFYAHYSTYIRPDVFNVLFSEQIFCFLMVGGIGSLWGGLIGSVAMTLIPEWMHAYEYWRPLTYGLSIVLIMMFMPGGFISLPRQVRLWRRGRLRE